MGILKSQSNRVNNYQLFHKFSNFWGKDQILSIFTWAECWSQKKESCIFIEMVNEIIVFV